MTSPEFVVGMYRGVRKLLADNGVQTNTAAGAIIGRRERTMKAYGSDPSLPMSRRIAPDDLKTMMEHAVALEIERYRRFLAAMGCRIPHINRQVAWAEDGGRRDRDWSLRQRWREAEPKALARGMTRKELADSIGCDPYGQIRNGIHWPAWRFAPRAIEVADIEMLAGIDPEDSAARFERMIKV